jgi:hypothetical protein
MMGPATDTSRGHHGPRLCRPRLGKPVRQAILPRLYLNGLSRPGTFQALRGCTCLAGAWRGAKRPTPVRQKLRRIWQVLPGVGRHGVGRFGAADPNFKMEV